MTTTQELLDLCGFEPEEAVRELPRVEKAFDRLRITPADVENCRERLHKYFHADLMGMRKIVGTYMRELVDLVLAKEEGKKNILYASIPAAASDILGAAPLHSDEVYASFPDVVIEFTLGSFFDKLDPVLEAAERLWLREGVAHCGLIKARLGALALDMIPKPDLFLSLGQMCDEAPKSDESLGKLFGIPVQYTNVCQDWDDEASYQRAEDFFTEQIRLARDKIGQVVGFHISDEMLREARRTKREYNMLVGEINDLEVESDPMPLNAACLNLLRLIPDMPLSRRNTEEAVAGVRLLVQELRDRVSQGVGVVPKGSPRVMIGLHPPFSHPSIMHMAEESGVALPVTEFAIFSPDGDLRSTRIDTDDPCRIIAHNNLTRNIQETLHRRIRSVIGACRRYKLDGVFWHTHHPCRPLAGDALMIKDGVQKELGLPVLVIESDNYDPRFYTAEQLRTRVEAFAETLRAAKTRRAAQ